MHPLALCPKSHADAGFSPRWPREGVPAAPTSWHLLHEDLDEAVLADGAQVLDNVLMPQALVQGNLLVQRL